MITLCMDTSHIFLCIGLIKDDTVIARYQEKCWKKQSETIFPELIRLMDDCSLKPEDIDQIVITDGPGSYTGIRIAMTIAKVFCALKDVPLYTIHSLQLYAGMNDCRVVLDARGKRVYTCRYHAGEECEAPSVKAVEELEIADDETVVGDGALAGREENYPDICENFLLLKDHWTKAENVHLVVPEYLKSIDSYLVKS